MAVLYPYPDNMTNITGLFYYADIGTGGLLGLGLLVIVGVTTFLASYAKGNDWGDCFAFASFLSFLVALGLRWLQLINDVVFFTTAIIVVASIVVLLVKRGKEEV